MKKEISDQEWESFLNAIPRNKIAPFGDYEEYLKKEGVTDEDINLWNSFSDFEQQKIKEETQTSILKIILALSENDGLSPEEAVKKLYKQTTTFDDYPYPPQTILELEKLGFVSEDDYPLPWELMERVDKYARLMFTDMEKFKETQLLVKDATSSNAGTRVLIKHGVV